ncbi:MAG TPA: polyphosphate kinase 2, partial [Candidatus Marinimicrobia bacterium]|nr:polyphosphate kinase 2 [Candidatus Neomarinimicrobiota bacterium]
WFSVSAEEQMKRFQARVGDPTKVWKLSPMDTESINRWDDYSKSKDNMMEHTDTDFSPWYIVESDVKKKARVNCISHLLSKIPYTDIEQPPVDLPERTPEDSYQRPDRSNYNYVTEII